MKREKVFYWTAIIVVLGAIVSMTLWIQSKPREWIPIGPTPDVPGYGEYTESPVPFPPALDCSIVPAEVSLGPSWNGLQIGKTTFEEVVQILVAENVKWVHNMVVFEYVIEDGTWEIIAACFSGDTLSALFHGIPGDEGSFEKEFMQKYGNPAYTTWSSYNTERVAIWPEEGILAILEDGGWNTPEPTIAILFSPISLKEFGKGWLWQAMPDESEVHLDSSSQLPFEEDPWGIAKYSTVELPEK